MSARTKDILLFVLIVLFIGALASTITLAVLYSNLLGEQSSDSPVTTPTTPIDENKLKRRINCFPEQQGSNNKDWEITLEQCTNRSCQYDTNTGGRKDIPICYMGDDIGYKVTKESSSADWYVELTLEPISTKTVFDPPIAQLTFKAAIWTNQHLQIKIEDAKNARYEVPFVSPLQRDSAANKNTADYEMTYTKQPFSFQIKRKSTGTILFDTSIGGFVYSNRFLQLASLLPSNNFYGLGEHEHPSLRHDMDRYRTWPMFGRDQGGLGEGTNLYGTHPFYMVLENDGNAHGVFLLNSNAMEYSTIPAPGVIMRTIGGIFDLHFSFGSTPNQVIQQQTAMVGRPFIPPYWSLGFHLSRYGYNNLSNMQAAVDRTRAAGIPLDVIYADIDHFDARKDFTIDMKNFAGLPQYFADQRNNEGLRSVIILDPAIPDVTGGGYEPWTKFNDKKSWITWEDGTTIMGYVWPDDKTAFPDFFLDRTKEVWEELIVKHYNEITFDGLWIDMNEPANFGTNEEKPFNWPADKPAWSLKCPASDLDTPPYRTWAASFYDDPKQGGRKAMLSDKTLCMSSKQNDGKYYHYDVHNLYGWSQTPPTVNGLRKTQPGKRGFVLARSTFAGSGAYAAHWLGDNLATWPHMHRSIIGMLEMSMFGIAHTGPDICGFMQQSSPELCLRWQQLGAFYPYSRNHNDLDSADQDPAAMGPEVAAATREYMLIRYAMLPYMYTLFYYANQDGLAVARPVFFEFPQDQATWGLDRQFMLGSGVMLAPLLNPGEDTVTAYVPQGTWYSYAKKLEFIDQCSRGTDRKFDINGTVALVRGGTILPSQDTTVPQGKSITTMETRKNRINLITVLDCQNEAEGSLFWDDGESLDTIAKQDYYLTEYSARIDRAGRLVLTSALARVSNDTTVGANMFYKSLVIVGNKLSNPATAEVSCKDAANCPIITSTSYTPDQKYLQLDFFGQGMPFINDFVVTATF